jgi:hypothetical protein
MQEPDFITPDQAETLLKPEIERLEMEGWKVTRHAQYVVRLKRNDRVTDIHIDLLGNITFEEKMAVTSATELGTLIAWMLLIAFFLVVLVFAQTVGLLE